VGNEVIDVVAEELAVLDCVLEDDGTAGANMTPRKPVVDAADANSV
jgi:hypothetical protein